MQLQYNNYFFKIFLNKYKNITLIKTSPCWKVKLITNHSGSVHVDFISTNWMP